MTSFDFIVAGAGIAGLAVASELSAHARVAVIERESQPGYHSTGRSAAIFVDGYGSAEVQKLTSCSRVFLEEIWKTEVPILKPRGLFQLVLDDSNNKHIVPTPGTGEVEVDIDYACRRVPILRRERMTRAIYDPNAADIDVHAMQTFFLANLRSSGSVLFSQHSGEIVRRNGLWHVDAGHTKLSAPIIINAAGAWAAELGASLGASALDLRPLRRSAALFHIDCDVAAWPMTVDADETIYFKPDAGTLMLSPADETLSPACDAAPEEIDIAIAAHRFELLTTCVVHRFGSRWAGLRTFAPDRNPVIGFDPVEPSLFWLAGQGGFGVQTAPAAGSLAASLLLQTEQISGLRSPDFLARISPCRFLDESANKLAAAPHVSI